MADGSDPDVMEGSSIHTFHAGQDGEPLSTAVIRAIACVEGVEPIEMDESLHDTVDPDALDSLFSRVAGSKPNGSVTFVLDAHEVTVWSDGEIAIRPQSMA